jgi:protease-4
MENKIGMSFDQVQTNPNAGFPSIVRPLNDYERNVLESKIEKIYSLFLDRVSENRNMSTEAVDEIGEGRVWSGTDARRLGLIDEFGGLHDAVELASEIAGVSTYRILELPIQKDPLEQLIEDLTAGTYHSFLKAELGIFYKDYMTARSAMKLNGVQALLPVGLTIE